MKKLILFLTFLIIHQTTGEDVIYYLDDETYSLMPPKYHLDRFERCIAPTGGMYCTAWADLVSDKPSQLLDTIKAYSAHDSKHYNYTNIRYGLCLTTTCDQFYGDSSQESLWNATEACLNETMTREFDLKTRVTDIDCYGHGHQFETNAVDHAILLVLALILALNVAGSVYDIWLRDQTKPGIEFLVTFSILANWKRLVAPPSDDPVKSRLRCLNGIKAMTSLLVVLGHIPMICINTAINPNFFESVSLTFFILPVVAKQVACQMSNRNRRPWISAFSNAGAQNGIFRIITKLGTILFFILLSRL